MQSSRRLNKAATLFWIDRTREAIFMCHYCDISSNSEDKYSNSVTVPKATPSYIRQRQNTVQQQNEKAPYTAMSTSPWWFSMSRIDNNFWPSLLGQDHTLSHQQDDDDIIEIEYGVTSRNLKEDYELYRV